MDYQIFPPEEILETTLKLPLSKSISARALVMAALGSTMPAVLSECADTQAMASALSNDAGQINIGAAGTAMRFLTAYFAAQPGREVTLDGSERMRKRPIKPLVDALRSLGAKIEYAGQEGFPPLKIEGRKLRGGELKVDSSLSSQFVSALMMVAPLMDAPLTLTLDADTVSMPYIKMTAEMMRRRGVAVEIERDVVEVSNRPYGPCSEAVEGDWSAAAFWYEIAAMTAGWVTIGNLGENSIQGDKALADIFPRLGVLTEFSDEGVELSATPELYSRLDIDLSDTPDLVQALAVTAVAIGLPFTFTGVGNLRIKETDRLEALRRELLKVGCVAEIDGNGSIFSWDGRRMPIMEMPQIDTYDDHRMAMAFAPLSVFMPGLVIRNIEVVSKSYPGFWDDLRNAGFTVVSADQTDEKSVVD